MHAKQTAVASRRDSARKTAQCPANSPEIADLYCLNRLNTQQAAEFETHFLSCTECLNEVETAGEFIRALRAVSGSRKSAACAAGA